MIENLKELFSQTETKSDFAILILGVVFGYIISIRYGLIPTIEPETNAVLFGSGILAVKKLIEVLFEKGFRKRNLAKKKNKIVTILKRDGLLREELSLQIEKQYELFSMDLISHNEFDTYLNKIVTTYLAASD